MAKKTVWEQLVEAQHSLSGVAAVLRACQREPGLGSTATTDLEAMLALAIGEVERVRHDLEGAERGALQMEAETCECSDAEEAA